MKVEIKMEMKLYTGCAFIHCGKNTEACLKNDKNGWNLRVDLERHTIARSHSSARHGR
jgi:hypothetical protein